jgi:hypothetical protein
VGERLPFVAVEAECETLCNGDSGDGERRPFLGSVGCEFFFLARCNSALPAAARRRGRESAAAIEADLRWAFEDRRPLVSESSVEEKLLTAFGSENNRTDTHQLVHIGSHLSVTHCRFARRRHHNHHLAVHALYL